MPETGPTGGPPNADNHSGEESGEEHMGGRTKRSGAQVRGGHGHKGTWLRVHGTRVFAVAGMY